MSRVARYVFASGSQLDEDLVDVPAEATEEEVLDGINRTLTTRTGTLVPLIVARDRDRDGRYNLIFTARLARIELLDL